MKMDVVALYMKLNDNGMECGLWFLISSAAWTNSSQLDRCILDGLKSRWLIDEWFKRRPCTSSSQLDRCIMHGLEEVKSVYEKTMVDGGMV